MTLQKLSRRDFMKTSLALGGAATLAACVPAQPTGDGGQAAAPTEEMVTLTFGRHWEALSVPVRTSLTMITKKTILTSISKSPIILGPITIKSCRPGQQPGPCPM